LGPLAKRFSGKTLLITGGAGFIGNYFLLVMDHLNRNVLDRPCRIISLDNFITKGKYKIQQGPNFTAIEHDVKNPLAIKEDIDFIVHAAGIASPAFYRTYKLETIEAGTQGTRNMLELAREKKAESMIFFSSSEIYGNPDPRFVPTPETYNGNVSTLGPRANYDESKRMGETFCVTYYDTYSTPVKIVRPFNIYGPGMSLDDKRVIPNFVSHAFGSRPLPVYGDGKNTRSYCYVTDAMVGFLRILLSGHNREAFNVGNDELEISVEDLAKTIIGIFNNNIGIKLTAAPNDAYAKDDPERRFPDITKLRTLLNYSPKVGLKEGLQRYIAWAIEEHNIKSPAIKNFRQPRAQAGEL